MSKKVDIIIVYQYIQWFIMQFNLFHQNKNAEIGHPKGRITLIKRDVSNSLRLWALYVFAQQQTANIAVSPYYKPKLYLSGSLSILMGQCLAAAQHPPKYIYEKNFGEITGHLMNLCTFLISYYAHRIKQIINFAQTQ